MKKVSDSNRFSIIHNMESCFICKRYPIEKHEIFGGSFRQSSKNYGLVIALCAEHHREAHKHGSLDKYLKQIGQQFFEEKYSREEYMKVFGINYL